MTRYAGEVAAPAKINLALHVTGRRADGYHLLESLVVFAPSIADRLSIRPSEDGADRLAVTGPLAANVPSDGGNIVLKALALARREADRLGIAIPPLAITLSKHLPSAAGIGGGSADAAALLAHLSISEPELAGPLSRAAIDLGADVPMCLAGRPLVATGVGETLRPVDLPTDLALVLVNCGTPVATPAVFKALARRDNPGLPALPPAGLADAPGLAHWLAETRNDLEAPAIALVPAIAVAVRKLYETGALFARMSGSGATVFGLFAAPADAHDGAQAISRDHPEWWVAAA